MTIIRWKHGAPGVQTIRNTALRFRSTTGILFGLMCFTGASPVTGQTVSCATFLLPLTTMAG